MCKTRHKPHFPVSPQIRPPVRKSLTPFTNHCNLFLLWIRTVKHQGLPCASTLLQDNAIHSRSKLRSSKTKQTTSATLATENTRRRLSSAARQFFPQGISAHHKVKPFYNVASAFYTVAAGNSLQWLSCGPSSLFYSFSVHHLRRRRRSQSGVRARSADLSALRQLSLTSATSSLPSLSSRFACSSGFSAPKRSMETCGGT